MGEYGVDSLGLNLRSSRTRFQVRFILKLFSSISEAVLT